MRQRSRNILLIFAFIASGCICKRPPIQVLPVPITGQHTSMWCWAARGEMTMNFQGASVTQCDEANKRFARTDCCNVPTPGACVVGGWPEYSKYGFSSVHTSSTPLSFSQLQDELFCKNRPVAFSWMWAPCGFNGGHMMVASGYMTALGTQFVRVNNPWPWDPTAGGAQYFTTYADYVAGSDHCHWDDYYQIHH